MTVSKRTLENWRKQALLHFDPALYDGTMCEHLAVKYNDFRLRILILTQELLDNYLLKRKP